MATETPNRIKIFQAAGREAYVDQAFRGVSFRGKYEANSAVFQPRPFTRSVCRHATVREQRRGGKPARRISRTPRREAADIFGDT